MNLFQRLFGRETPAGDLQRELLIESMLLMIAADGVVDEDEMDRFMRLVLSSPELDGVDAQSVDRYVQASFFHIKRDGLKGRLRAIANGIRTRSQRLTAMRMALLVGRGDGALIDREAELIEQMRLAFDLSREDVQHLREEGDGYIERELAMSDGAGDVEAYFVETLLLMAAADGVLEPRELDKFGHQLASRDEFALLTPEQAGTYMDMALRNIQRDGVEERLTCIADHLATPAARLSAFRMALEMCVADGYAEDRERTLLKMMQAAFGLSDESISDEIDRVLNP